MPKRTGVAPANTGGSVDEWIRLATLAEMLDTTPGAIYARRHRGDGPPAYRLGGTLRFRRSEVVAWLETHREQPAADEPA